MSKNLSRYSDLQLRLANYLRNPNHFAFHSYVFFPCESFDEFIDHYLEADLNTLFKEKLITDVPELYADTDYASIPLAYMVLNLDSFFENNFRQSSNFISALISILDLDDYYKRELMARLLSESAPLFIKFKKVARNIDDFPIAEKSLTELLDLHNSISYKLRQEIETITESEDD